jgi:radical SAM superfamily enzyme YgiQ (UPF0313 family)
MTDVLLTHSYHLFYDPKQVRKMQPYPPLGTLYAAALLRRHGFSVALFDTMLEDPVRGFPAALARHRPRVVAVYEDNFNFLSKMCLTRMRQVAFGMLKAARAQGALVVANGSDASDHAEEYLREGFDTVLLGEAEQTLLEFVGAALEDTSLVEPGRFASAGAEAIPGLIFRNPGTGRLIRTLPRNLLSNLDELPFPARDLIDLERYRGLWKSAHGFFSLNAVASRGCPFRCNWCAKPIYGNAFHARSATWVAEEMRELKASFGAEHIWFADDIFGLKPRWLSEFAEAVERRQARLPFKMQSRVDLMKAEAVRALWSSGCEEVWMGVESGSQRILDAMDKGTRMEDIPAARENLRRYGIRACFFLQFGYPGEIWEDIQQTVRLVRETRPDDIGVSVAYPLPGTRFYERVRAELGAKANWVDSDDLSMIFKGTYTSEFYRALRDALHAEVETWRRDRTLETTPAEAGPQAAETDPGRVERLWEIVHRLEKSCRNLEPTLASCGHAG